MPLATFSVCETVPEGFTQVIAVEGLTPNRFAYFLLVAIVSARSAARTSPSRETFESHCPVTETPRRRSDSQFVFHSSERYGKCVSVDWYVPRIVATRAFLSNVSFVSLLRAMISVRLQNCFDFKIISPPG